MSSVNGIQPGGSGNVYHSTNVAKPAVGNLESGVIQKLYGTNKNATVTPEKLEQTLDSFFASSGLKRKSISADPAYDAAFKKAAGKDGKLSSEETHNLLAGLFGQGKKLAAPAA